MASEMLFTIWQGGQLAIPFRETLGKYNSGGQLHTVQTADLSIPSIRQIPQLHSWIENKFMLRLLLRIRGLFLPPNFTLSFHYPSSEGASVQIQSEDIMEKFLSFLVGMKQTHLTLFVHICLVSQLQKGIVNKFQNTESIPRT
jgi:hypothetical protein